MLVLSRKLGERIIIEPGIEVVVVDVRGNKVRLGIDAPASVSIRRQEVPRKRDPAIGPEVCAGNGWPIPAEAGEFI